jgi:peptidoglycan/LPS O-acetylase OafA/YrhL
MAALHHVGMLNPLWSIGVEEQFYLFWAPMVKWFGGKMLALVLTFVALTLTAYAILSSSFISRSEVMETFVRSLRFHYMAIGSVFSWILFHHRDRYERSPFASGWFQIATVIVLLYHYAYELPGTGSVVRDVALACLYGTLILNVSVIPNRLINLEWQPLVHLGQISYGIYMFHMTIDYLLRTAAGRLPLSGPAVVIACGYAGVLLAVTIAVAHVSYTYFETYFTKPPLAKAETARAREARRVVGLAAP